MFAGPAKLAETEVDAIVLVQVLKSNMTIPSAGTSAWSILLVRLDREELLLLLKHIVG